VERCGTWVDKECESPRVFRVYDKEMANWRLNSRSQ
jgi:hypothetical protein